MAPLRLAFAGTPEFAARHLEALLLTRHHVAAVLTQPDRPAGRGKQARPGPVKCLAQTRGLPVLQPGTLRDAAVQAELAALELDVLVVVAYGLLLPQAVLDLPRHGCVNVHGSLLPRWRGAAPIQRAIEAGDAESGITVMLMDAGLDTGPMLARRSVAITPLATSGDLYAQLADVGPRLLVEVLDELPARLTGAEAQDDAQATYAAKITKGEACLDWHARAAVLARRIRAFNPAPGAYALLDGQRIKIWSAQPLSDRNGSPGTIIAADDRGICVACGEGALLLTSLQLPGSRILEAADLLRGRAGVFAPGRRFDAVSAA